MSFEIAYTIKTIDQFSSVYEKFNTKIDEMKSRLSALSPMLESISNHYQTMANNIVESGVATEVLRKEQRTLKTSLFQTATAQNSLNTKLTNAETTYEMGRRSAVKYNTAVDTLNESLRNTSSLSTVLAKNQKTYNFAMRRGARFSKSFEAGTVRVGNSVSSLNEQLKKTGGILHTTARGNSEVNNGFGNMIRKTDILNSKLGLTNALFGRMSKTFMIYSSYVVMSKLITGITGGLADIVKKGGAFDTMKREVSAITGFTKPEMSYLARQSFKLAQGTGIDVMDVMEAFKLGASKRAELVRQHDPQGLVEMTKASSLLVREGFNLSEATRSLSSVLNVFEMPISKSGRVADYLAALEKYSASETPETFEALKRSAQSGRVVGLSFQQQLAAIGGMAQADITGPMAGTSLNAIYARMTKAGYDFTSMKLHEAFKLFETELKALNTPQDKINKMLDVFKLRQIKAGGALMTFNDLLRQLESELNETGLAAQQAQERIAGYERTSKALETFGTETKTGMFSKLAPTLLGFKKEWQIFLYSIGESGIIELGNIILRFGGALLRIGSSVLMFIASFKDIIEDILSLEGILYKLTGYIRFKPKFLENYKKRDEYIGRILTTGGTTEEMIKRFNTGENVVPYAPVAASSTLEITLKGDTDKVAGMKATTDNPFNKILLNPGSSLGFLF